MLSKWKLLKLENILDSQVTSFTVCAWIMYDGASSYSPIVHVGHDDWDYIISSDYDTPSGHDEIYSSNNWTGDNDYMSVWLVSNEGKALRLYSYGTSGNNNRRTVYFKSTTNPVHAVISYDSSTTEVKLYFRGGAVGNNEVTHTFVSGDGANFNWNDIISGTTNIYIGSYNINSRWYTYSVYKNRH